MRCTLPGVGQESANAGASHWYRLRYYDSWVARKTLADLERNPKGVRLRDLLAILRDEGFQVREGTRHGYIAIRGNQTLTIPRHRTVVLPVYVRQAIRFIKEEPR